MIFAIMIIYSIDDNARCVVFVVKILFAAGDERNGASAVHTEQYTHSQLLYYCHAVCDADAATYSQTR
jgi:hypothetical protein